MRDYVPVDRHDAGNDTQRQSMAFESAMICLEKTYIVMVIFLCQVIYKFAKNVICR
jgi:type III secretory pathway component EscS